jgi:hypothetical protein
MNIKALHSFSHPKERQFIAELSAVLRGEEPATSSLPILRQNTNTLGDVTLYAVWGDWHALDRRYRDRLLETAYHQVRGAGDHELPTCVGLTPVEEHIEFQLLPREYELTSSPFPNATRLKEIAVPVLVRIGDTGFELRPFSASNPEGSTFWVSITQVPPSFEGKWTAGPTEWVALASPEEAISYAGGFAAEGSVQ